jgi:putative hydrolase
MLIQADLHTHTIASTHAYSTVTENATAAEKAGLKALAITDHAPSISDAPHAWHFHNYRVLPRFMGEVRLLFGIEVNIMDTEGTIDIDEYELERLDWIVASMHSECYSHTTPENNTQAFINVAKNQPMVDLIGHPMNTSYPFDVEKVIKTFKEYDKLVEINEAHLFNYRHSHAFALEIIKLCKKYEVPMCIDSDAHYHGMLGNYPFAEQLISAADFPTSLIFNADIDRVLDRIRNKTYNGKPLVRSIEQ